MYHRPKCLLISNEMLYCHTKEFKVLFPAAQFHVTLHTVLQIRNNLYNTQPYFCQAQQSLSNNHADQHATHPFTIYIYKALHSSVILSVFDVLLIPQGDLVFPQKISTKKLTKLSSSNSSFPPSYFIPIFFTKICLDQ